MSRGAGSGSPFVEMGFIRMRRVRGLERWVGGWSRRGGRGSRSCQVSPGGRGWRQVQRAGRGLERTRVLTVREDLIQQSGGDRQGVCHLRGADVTVRDERGGLGGGSQLQWAREEQVPDGTAILSNHRGGAGGAAAVPQN